MNKRLQEVIGPLIAVFIFGAALFFLHSELKHHSFHEIIGHVRDIHRSSLYLALTLTFFNYLVLTMYDTMAVRYIRHPLPYKKTALGSFLGYAFSQGLGFGFLVGSSMRFRLYSAWGLSALEIAGMVAFNGLTFWIGYLFLAGVIFLVEPSEVPRLVHLPFLTLKPLGGIALFLVTSYFLLGVFRKRPVKLLRWEFSVPNPGYFFIQLLVSSLDWAVAASVCYVLLPHTAHFTYFGFLGVFLLAQVVGIVSHVPGGIGVFEGIVVLILSPKIAASQLLGSLLAYRAIYYILPLSLASVLFAANEYVANRRRLDRLARLFGKWAPAMVPDLLAYSVFIAGVVLLFSGALPADITRIKWLQDFMPLPVIELSHFLGSLSGMMLLILAREIQRRIDAAYFITALILAGGVTFSLLKGFDYEEAIVLSVMLGLLLPSRKYFFRKASLVTRSFTPEWVLAIITAIMCTVWLGLFSYKHVDYSHDLWWRFAFYEDAPRFLRATVGVVGAALYFAIAALLKPGAKEPAMPGPEEVARARSVVEKSPHIVSSLALTGDKVFLFSDSGAAFIMYGISGRSWVSMGDPVGPREEWPELCWRFMELSDQHGGATVFYEVGQDDSGIYRELGLNFFKIGEEARVELDKFSLTGNERKGLRHSHNRSQAEGGSFEVLPAGASDKILPELEQVSDQWLKDKNTREKGFSLGHFNPEYLRYFPLGLVRRNGKVVAFVNILAGAGKEEMSLDLMRYSADAPASVLDYLFIELMLRAKQEGYKWFNLGMAPLAGLEDFSASPVWHRLGNLVYEHGESFYNFQGLRHYKQKFDPVWAPRFIASPGGIALPAVLADLARLTSRGIKGVVSK
jgi:phosphatidylglycerol lysyltransferase